MEAGEIAKVPSFRWEINIDCFDGKNVGDVIRSPTFFSHTGGSINTWELQLYPKGSSEDKKNYLSLFLRNLSEKEVTATFTLSLLNQNNIEVDNCPAVENHLFKSKYYWGFERFFSESFIRDKNKNVLKDNKLTVLCTIIVKEATNKENKEDIHSTKKNATKLKILDDYEKVFSNEEFSDVTITAEGKSFHLHKCILTARSTFFEGMFRNDMKEKIENKIEIKDIRYEVLEEFFRFIYTGKVRETDKIICELLTAAEKYSIEELKVVCEDIMSNNLKKNNAIEYLDSAIMNRAEKIESAAVKFISLNIENFIEDLEFEELGTKHPKVLLKIIKTFT